MKKIILSIALSVVSSVSGANSLQDQLSAVAQAEQQGNIETQRQSDLRQEKLDREARVERQRRADANAIATKRANAIAAEKRAHQEKIAAESLSDKKRDQHYEDELRDLEIQKLKLALAREEARVKRENEFIDQDLKGRAAQNEVIQSKADVNRNLSEGGRELMKSEGKAREKESSGWFN